MKSTLFLSPKRENKNESTFTDNKYSIILISNLFQVKWIKLILTWVPSIPLEVYLELLEVDALMDPLDFPFSITPSELAEILSLIPEYKPLPFSLVEFPNELEFPTVRSGIKGRIDSATIEFKHGSSSICTIFVALTVEGTFLGLKFNSKI